MVTEGLLVQVASRVLGVSGPSYYAWRKLPRPVRAVGHASLSKRIRAVHAASRGPYCARRVYAELLLGHSISVGYLAVEHLMRTDGFQELSDPARYLESAPCTATDLSDHHACGAPGRVVVIDITGHSTRVGNGY